RLLRPCDLAGFNVKRFDLPFLLHEFARAGVRFPLGRRAVVDVMQIFHEHERRDLAAAVRHYLGREHRGGHRAGADAYATAAVLDAQLGRSPGLPRTVPELHGCLSPVDLAGRFGRREDGAVAFAFGKYADVPLAEVAHQDPGYLRWLLGQDFLPDVRELV